jgi:hypothetical protein
MSKLTYKIFLLISAINLGFCVESFCMEQQHSQEDNPPNFFNDDIDNLLKNNCDQDEFDKLFDKMVESFAERGENPQPDFKDNNAQEQNKNNGSIYSNEYIYNGIIGNNLVILEQKLHLDDDPRIIKKAANNAQRLFGSFVEQHNLALGDLVTFYQLWFLYIVSYSQGMVKSSNYFNYLFPIKLDIYTDKDVLFLIKNKNYFLQTIKCVGRNTSNAYCSSINCIGKSGNKPLSDLYSNEMGPRSAYRMAATELAKQLIEAIKTLYANVRTQRNARRPEQQLPVGLPLKRLWTGTQKNQPPIKRVKIDNGDK